MNKLDELHKIFSNVNDWLKFAEAKNAVLIGFIGALLIGLLSLLSANNTLVTTLIKFLLFPIEILALIISVLSFLPKLNLIKKKKNKSKRHYTNIYYFGHLKDLTQDDLLKELYFSEGLTSPKEFQKLETDLASQIVNNAGIAWDKSKSFEVACLFSIAGIFFTIIAYLILSMFCKI